jgi:hypothetical protein
MIEAAPVALGLSLSRRGIFVVIALCIVVLTTAGMSAFAFVLAAQSRSALVYHVPIIASNALACGGGFWVALASASRALRRDRDSGVRDLFAMRGRSLGGYLTARIGGLAVLLAMAVGGGTLVSGLFAMAARSDVAVRSAHATLAAVVFALAFAVLMAPVALAAVGARSRFGGLMTLLTVVALPELVVRAFASVLPQGVANVLAIPSALVTLRSALMPGQVDALQALRALVALTVFGAMAIALVRRNAILIMQNTHQAHQERDR